MERIVGREDDEEVGVAEGVAEALRKEGAHFELRAVGPVEGGSDGGGGGIGGGDTCGEVDRQLVGARAE
eukprot:scaffold145100_cov109-Phaeocystis_antarctica.AAC.1